MRSQAVCTIDGCTAKVRSKSNDICARHHAKANNPPCSVDGCERYSWSKGLCSTHLMRLKKRGTLDDPPPPKRRYTNRYGYVIVYAPNHPSAPPSGLIGEHRLVMEKKLGRLLTSMENVHHINGVRDDNRPENLELWDTSQPSGQRVEDKVAWAKEFLINHMSPEELRDWIEEVSA